MAEASRNAGSKMTRKDCGQHERSATRWRVIGGTRYFVLALTLIGGLDAWAPAARAGTVRLWRTAVVVSDSIHLDDLCELRGFDAETRRRLTDPAVLESPPPGETRIVHLSTIRSWLAERGVNMAEVSLGGAISCDVTRPLMPSVETPTDVNGENKASSLKVGLELPPPGSIAEKKATTPPIKKLPSAAATLRGAVLDYFNNELGRYHATAEVGFDRASESSLDLSGPKYEFRVRRQSGPPIGLVSIEVDVISDGKLVQTLPLVAQVGLVRRSVVARRAINQGATIAPSDLELVSQRHTGLENLGLADPTQVIGQRAKRMIPAGEPLDLDRLEAVPLVLRGQLVTLESIAQGVRVVTSAKAAEDGLLGETIKVRSTENRRIEFDAKVTGPGRVEMRVNDSEPARPKAVEGPVLSMGGDHP